MGEKILSAALAPLACRRILIAIAAVALSAVALGLIVATQASGRPDPDPNGECIDLVDNDEDGLLDDEDPTCSYTPRLIKSEAINEVRFVLEWKVGQHAEDARVRCRRSTRVRFSCRVSWFIGDVSYSGRLNVRMEREGESAALMAKGTVHEIDNYCRDTGGDNCRRSIRIDAGEYGFG